MVRFRLFSKIITISTDSDKVVKEESVLVIHGEDAKRFIQQHVCLLNKTYTEDELLELEQQKNKAIKAYEAFKKLNIK